MIRLMLAIAALLGLSVPVSASAQALQTYRMDFGAFKGFSITIVNDVGVIAPEMQRFDRTSLKLAANVRPMGLAETQGIFAEIVKKTGAGDATPYFVSAFVNSLNDIDRHLVFGRPDLVGSLVPERLHHGGALTVHVFASRNAFRLWLARTVPSHGADAAYDPRTNTIGVFVDKSLLSYFGYQAGWTGYPDEYFVRELRLYVEQLFVRTISHEVVHYLQYNSESSFYSLPAIREGFAVAIASELESRHEVLMLVADMYASGRDPSDLSPMDDRGEKCTESGYRNVLNFPQVEYYGRAAEALKERPNFSLSDLMFGDSRRNFYQGPEADLSTRYAFAFVAARFIASMNAEEHAAWNRLDEEVRKTGRLVSSARDVVFLDADFRDYVRHRLDPGPIKQAAQVGSAEEAASRLTTCMDISSPNALIWGQVANMIEPGDANIALKVGDVFSDSDFVTSDGKSAEGHSLSTLDYYTLARDRMARVDAMSAKCSTGATPGLVFDYVRIHARLGERYAEIGDVATAIQNLRCAVAAASRGFKEGHGELIALLPTVLNAEIRLHVYSLSQSAGFERARTMSDLVRERTASTATLIWKLKPDLDTAEGRQEFFTSTCLIQLLSLSIIDGQIRIMQAKLAPGRKLPAQDVSLCGLSIH